MIYACARCLFTFKRLSKVDSCPDCASTNVREASADEIAEYERNIRQVELGNNK